jgi:hypothetical protein
MALAGVFSMLAKLLLAHYKIDQERSRLVMTMEIKE